MGYHARKSPSGSKRWSKCTASLLEEAGKPNESSEASRWGTTNHLLSSTCLIKGEEPYYYAGWQCIFWHHPESESQGESLLAPNEEPDMALEISHAVPIDDEQIECATVYVNFVRELKHSLDAKMWVEQPVPIDHITDESEATGNADVIFLLNNEEEIVVIDLKAGMYRVDAMERMTVVVNDDLGLPIGQEIVEKPNTQLAMYGSGALRKFGSPKVKRIRLIIVMPRLRHVSEITITTEQLGETVRWLRERAGIVETNPTYFASFETCQYCKGKSTCVEFTNKVAETVFTDATLTQVKPVMIADLGTLYKAVDLVEMWCASVRSLTYKELMEWRGVPGVKLVQGRMGNRKWGNPERAREILERDLGVPKSLIVVEKFVGPASIEKLAKAKKGHKPVLNPFQWKVISRMITQDQGKPGIAPEDDPRPALEAPEAGFSEVISGTDSPDSENQS